MKFFKIVALSFTMLISFINAQTFTSSLVHILGTTNVNGETEPCG